LIPYDWKNPAGEEAGWHLYEFEKERERGKKMRGSKNKIQREKSDRKQN